MSPEDGSPVLLKGRASRSRDGDRLEKWWRIISHHGHLWSQIQSPRCRNSATVSSATQEPVSGGPLGSQL